jgi:hypothetical protein
VLRGTPRTALGGIGETSGPGHDPQFASWVENPPQNQSGLTPSGTDGVGAASSEDRGGSDGDDPPGDDESPLPGDADEPPGTAFSALSAGVEWSVIAGDDWACSGVVRPQSFTKISTEALSPPSAVIR